MCALLCQHAPPIDRITIRGDIAGALGFVQHADPAHRYVVTRGQLLDQICTLFGGREAEALLLDDLSIGSASDLEHATSIARALVEEYGDGGDERRRRPVGAPPGDRGTPTPSTPRARVDEAIQAILERERARAKHLLETNRPLLIALRDLLLEKKVLDRTVVRPPRPLAGGPRPWLSSSCACASIRRPAAARWSSTITRDSDALPIEHEDEHRRLAGKVVEGGLSQRQGRGHARAGSAGDRGAGVRRSAGGAADEDAYLGRDRGRFVR